MGKVSRALRKAEGKQQADSQPEDKHHSSGFRPPESQEREHSHRRTSVTPPTSKDLEHIDTENWDERLVNSTRNMTGIAEGLRKIRTMILHRKGVDTIRSIMVLSSDPQEGKSFVCASLGITFAKSVEHRALLIDCDLRRPSLGRLFGLKQQEGLADYLADGNDISPHIHSTGLPKLSIIPSGSPPKNPAELLASEKMPYLLEELAGSKSDRLLILDTPPFHAASETIVLSELVDAIVMVVRWGKSGRENVKKMADTIGRDKIIGTVFNAFEMNVLDRKVQGVGYHNYYSEYY